MKKSLLSPPDPFGLSPLVLLLPVIGRVGGLSPLTSSLFARFEKVQGLKDELSTEPDRAAFRRLAAEESMLKEVLDWLAVRPEEPK
jgi:hypothetical protein